MPVSSCCSVLRLAFMASKASWTGHEQTDPLITPADDVVPIELAATAAARS
eukprot:SAG22_NODE_2088_length_3030_cov_7.531900_6_plen_51_part_00